MEQNNCEQFIEECKQAAEVKKMKKIEAFKERIKPLLVEFPTLEVDNALEHTVSICGETFQVEFFDDEIVLSAFHNGRYYGRIRNKAEFGEYIIKKEGMLKNNKPEQGFWRRLFS